MKIYRLTSKDIKELNSQTITEMVKELDRLLTIKRRSKNEKINSKTDI